jgi:hypothetical protein
VCSYAQQPPAIGSVARRAGVLVPDIAERTVSPRCSASRGARFGVQAFPDGQGDHRCQQTAAGKRRSRGFQEPVCAGGRDRDRTCDFCRVKGARPPRAPTQHPAPHHIIAAQRLWRTGAIRRCVWQSEASSLANLWQAGLLTRGLSPDPLSCRRSAHTSSRGAVTPTGWGALGTLGAWICTRTGAWSPRPTAPWSWPAAWGSLVHYQPMTGTSRPATATIAVSSDSPPS